MGATTSTATWFRRALVAVALNFGDMPPHSINSVDVVQQVGWENGALPARSQYLNSYHPLPPGSARPVVLLGGGVYVPDEAFVIAKDWAGRSNTETYRVSVCTWAGESVSGPDQEPVDVAKIIKRFNPPGDPSEIEICTLPTVQNLLEAAEAGDIDEVVRAIEEQLNASSVVYFTGGDQAVLVFMMQKFPQIREVLLKRLGADGSAVAPENEPQSAAVYVGTSASTAIALKRTILGNGGRGPDDSGLRKEQLRELSDQGRYEHSLVAREGLGLNLIPGISFVDQHFGWSRAFVERLKAGEEMPLFLEDGVTPAEEIRPKRTARLMELTTESLGLAIFHDCGLVFYEVDGKKYLRVFVDNPDSPYRAPGLPAAGLFNRGEVTHLYPGSIYELTEDGVVLCESGSEEE